MGGEATVLFNIRKSNAHPVHTYLYLFNIKERDIGRRKNCIGFIIIFLSFSFWFHAYCSVGHAIIV
jgi:hypothetical protein